MKRFRFSSSLFPHQTPRGAFIVSSLLSRPQQQQQQQKRFISISNPFSSSSSSTTTTTATKTNNRPPPTIISPDELSMMETEELTRELRRFGFHNPNKHHLELVVREMITRGAVIISVKTVREAIKLCYLSGDRRVLYPLAIELFLARVYGGSSENDMKMLGLPEELVDCAAMCEVGDPLQKLISITRTTESTLRNAHSADVVPGIEMSLFRALWRCFVILRDVRLMTQNNNSNSGNKEVLDDEEDSESSFSPSSSSTSLRREKELEVMEAARRIFDLLTIVNKKILNLSATSSLLTASSTFSSSTSSSALTSTAADENLAFKQLCRLISLRVLYSDPSPQYQHQSSSTFYAGDDGEAEFFRLLFSRRLFQAEVSGSPAARFLSLIKTCENGARHDIATEYFEQYEVSHPFLVKPMESLSENDDAEDQNTGKEKLMILLPFQVEQFELVLKSYWGLLLKCGENKKVVRTLVKYLEIFEEHAYQLPAPLLSVAMRAVGEVQESNVAAKTMASLLKSFSVSSSSSSSASSSANDRSNVNDPNLHNDDFDQDEHNDHGDDGYTSNNNNHDQEQQQQQRQNKIIGSGSNSLHARPPTKYEMLTCLSALAKCGHPSFDQALETCVQENLIDTSSPLRVSELRLQYALNDPIDSLEIVQEEITKCQDAGYSIKQDFRCAGLILQILLRIDGENFLPVFKEVVGGAEVEDNHNNNNGEESSTLATSFSDGSIRDVPSSWVDWLIVWSLRRRYELTNQDRKYILDVMEKKKAPSYSIAPQAELIRMDFEKEKTSNNKNLRSTISNTNNNTFNDPRCAWPKRKSAISSLLSQKSFLREDGDHTTSIGDAFGGFAATNSMGSAACPLVDKLMSMSGKNKNSAFSDAASMVNTRRGKRVVSSF